ncbi:MAG: hypothetical protein EBU88_07870 [Acidobacteria bacterium]|nr:hypothetical protein [Acidobacteriota bacterium]
MTILNDQARASGIISLYQIGSASAGGPSTVKSGATRFGTPGEMGQRGLASNKCSKVSSGLEYPVPALIGTCA